MFCKNCGYQNTETSKFCRNCGLPIIVHLDEKVEGVSETVFVNPRKQVKSPVNVFQKLLLLISLLWFIVLLFFIPYKEDDEIVYDTLWADRSDVNWIMALLQFSLLLVVSIWAFYLLKRLNTINKDKYKLLAKREFVLFVLLSLSIILPGVILSGINYITKRNIISLEADITELNMKISSTTTKVDKRAQFWKVAAEHYDMNEFNNNVGLYWNYLIANVENETWLSNYYNSFKVYLGIPYYKKGEVDSSKIIDALILNHLKSSLGIASPVDLKSFLIENILFDEDIKRDKEKKRWINDSVELRKEINNSVIYTNSDFRRISLISFLFFFSILYLVRPLLWFVKGIINEIK